MFSGLFYGLGALTLLFAQTPTSTNFVLPAYDFGAGGTDSSTSTNYGLNALSGAQSGDPQTSTSYAVNSGFNPTLQANVPPAPTLTNPANFYDRLQLVIDTGGNPTDAVFLVAVSDDSFVTSSYVQPDNSIGSTYNSTTFRTYASYGGGSGFEILGLSSNTTYEVRVSAMRGDFTESGFGPESSAVSTVGPELNFGLTTTLTAVPPFAADFSSLTAGSVFSADADVNVTMTTNATQGGAVYIGSSNAALFSTLASYSINSATADLAAASTGYGAQVISTSQTSGGPITSQAPFNGAGDNVGGLTSTLQELLATTNPVDGADSTFRLKAKADAVVPATTDYADQLTIVAATNY